MEKAALRWPAPAKLNLMLRITGRRTDGYHELQTVFQFLDFEDELRFALHSDRVVERTTPLNDVPTEQDLTLRAAKLLQSQSGTSRGVSIDITKRIPMGGGLGGGSSDAATTLVALNYLWETGLSTEELARLGLQLGADVPVFVNGVAAWAEGVGECLEPIDLPEPWYLVITPDCVVPTAAVFGDPQLTRDSVPIKIADFLSEGGSNDCLSVVCKRFPAVASALDWLSQYGEARLTGTGSSIFAAFDRREEAESALLEIPDRWFRVVARGVNRSPLLDHLERQLD